MKELLQDIITQHVPQGCIFDAHSIIEYLIQNHSDVYLSSFKNGTTESYHSVISKNIDSFDGIIIDRMRDNESWSSNIHNKFTKNACWIKR